MQPKKTPMRKCVGCGEMKPKKELRRIVRSPEGEISVDLTGKKSGRGAYLCADPACLAKAEKGKRLDRAAMQLCSKALGHNRVEVVANNYIRAL